MQLKSRLFLRAEQNISLWWTSGWFTGVRVNLLSTTPTDLWASSKCNPPQRCPCFWQQAHNRWSWNGCGGYILSPGLGRFYGGAGHRRAAAEKNKVDSWSLRCAADRKDSDSDRSQHRWIQASPLDWILCFSDEIVIWLITKCPF